MRLDLRTAECSAVSHRYAVLVAVGLVLNVAFLGTHGLWYPDEPDIAEVALAMFNSGDWIAPRRMGEVWVDYPPMIYWLANIGSYALGGMTAFAVRLPNALLAIAIACITCAAGSRWFGARSGLWAGFALLLCPQFLWQANGYRPDIAFTLGIAAGLMLYAVGALADRGGRLKVAGFACLGFAMLAKGILGLLLPGLILALWHGARREWRPLVLLAPLSLVSLAIFVPWAFGTAHAMGWDDILNEFYAQNIGRFFSGDRGHDQPPWYYLRSFWVDLWPWAVLFPVAVVWTWRSGLRNDPRVQLLLWWSGTFIVFLTLAATKRQLYLIPAYPAIMLILGRWLAEVVRSEGQSADAQIFGARSVKRASIFVAAMLLAVGIACLVFAGFADSLLAGRDLLPQQIQVAAALRVPLAVLGVSLVLAASWIGWTAIREGPRTVLIRTALAHVAIWVVVLGLVVSTFEPTKTYRPQSLRVRELVGPEETHIGMVNPAEGIAKRGAFAFEMGGVMVDLLDDSSEVEEFFAAHPGSVVLIESSFVDDLFGGREAELDARTLDRLPVSETSYLVIRRELGHD